MKVVEMCCGYGGASAGMLAAGLTIEASYDGCRAGVDKSAKMKHPSGATNALGYGAECAAQAAVYAPGIAISTRGSREFPVSDFCIPLTQGKFAVVDAEDHEGLSVHRWHYDATTGYARRKAKISDGVKPGTPIYMHRQIARPQEGFVVDHIDGNKLNNVSSNLRVCTQQQNSFNSAKGKNNTSGFKGVQLKNGRWMAFINVNRKMRYLGYFDSPQAAALEYNKAAVELHGEFAQLNEVPCG